VGKRSSAQTLNFPVTELIISASFRYFDIISANK
jgi:hypothetical protein